PLAPVFPNPEKKVVEQPAPAPKPVPKAEDVPQFVIEPIPEVKPAPTPEPEPMPLVDVNKIEQADIINEGDCYSLEDQQVINIMVLAKNNREERRELTKRWKQIEDLKGHPVVGNLATLLSDGHPFCLCNEVLLLTYNFTRLKNKANIKNNQPAISKMVEQLLGRPVFVYALDRLDCNKYLTTFSNLEQLNRLPSKNDIEIIIPKGD
ncbi:MAG: hypothetical protein J5736_00295, partial [Bacilli bacterium]|nr:hypothetical protein [Bacilli bacterium]